jgi:hypothetical protein
MFDPIISNMLLGLDRQDVGEGVKMVEAYDHVVEHFKKISLKRFCKEVSKHV